MYDGTYGCPETSRDGSAVRALASQPLWPGFDSRTRARRHTWVEFVVGSRPCSEGFSPNFDFPPSSMAIYARYYAIAESRITILLLNIKIKPSSYNTSQLITLHTGAKPTPVLCHMGDFGCGDGGWTPVMKIDGNKV